MSQPIGHQFSVEAQNAANVATSNYGLFADGIIVDLRYLAEQLDGSDLSTRTLATTNWNDGEWGRAHSGNYRLEVMLIPPV
ncbi:hypothetical protein QW180_12035 [Vibrio sinaloensis]|nr:hypothetical protein [Vibrio sinaloensis]